MRFPCWLQGLKKHSPARVSPNEIGKMTSLKFLAPNPKSQTNSKHPTQKSPSPPPSPLRGEGKGEGSTIPDEQPPLEARDEGKHFSLRGTDTEQGKGLHQ